MIRGAKLKGQSDSRHLLTFSPLIDWLKAILTNYWMFMGLLELLESRGKKKRSNLFSLSGWMRRRRSSSSSWALVSLPKNLLFNWCFCYNAPKMRWTRNSGLGRRNLRRPVQENPIISSRAKKKKKKTKKFTGQNNQLPHYIQNY